MISQNKVYKQVEGWEGNGMEILIVVCLAVLVSVFIVKFCIKGESGGSEKDSEAWSAESAIYKYWKRAVPVSSLYRNRQNSVHFFHLLIYSSYITHTRRDKYGSKHKKNRRYVAECMAFP